MDGSPSTEPFSKKQDRSSANRTPMQLVLQKHSFSIQEYFIDFKIAQLEKFLQIETLTVTTEKK